jgi:hypothetical protein
MSRHAEIVRDFGDGTYRFRLALGQLRELEEKRNAPATVIFARISTGAFWIDDPRETIRLALIGGEDVTPVKALKLVERYVDGRPAYEWMPLATDVLGAALVGPPKEDDKKKEETTQPTEQYGSTFGESTATVQ